MSLSNRVSEDLRILMPKIEIQVAQRSSKIPFIDMGTAENWLIREEIMKFSVRAIAEEMTVEVGNSDCVQG